MYTRRSFLFLVWLLSCSLASAQSETATLTWTPPTENTDGTPLTDLSSYNIRWGCTASGEYDSVEVLQAPASEYVVSGLPDSGQCYFVAESVNSSGVASSFSNEATKSFALDLPGVVSNLVVTWQESTGPPPMTIASKGISVNPQSSTTSPSNTHGITINSGDLVLAYVHADDDGYSITADSDAGAAWNNPVNGAVGSETATHSMYWKIANGTEPATYAWTLGQAEKVTTIVRVFSGNNLEIDAAANAPGRTGTNDTDMIVNAVDGEVISDGALSVIFGGKDYRSGNSSDVHTTADNSYIGVDGSAEQQNTASAYRIYTTGETFSGNVTITDPQADSDRSFSIHISFVEGASGATLTMQEAQQSMVADAPTLTQSSALTLAESLQSIATDSPSLMQANSLSVDESLLSNASENIELSQSVSLALDAIAQTTTADGLALVQSHSLVVSPSDQSVGAESVTLSSAGALVVSEALLDQAVDNVILSTVGVLAVAEALQNVFSDSPGLTQSSTLTAADTLQALTVENVSLSQSVQLAVEEALLAVGADPVTLSTTPLLQIAEAVISLQAESPTLTESATIVISDALLAMLADIVPLARLKARNHHIMVVQRSGRVLVVGPRSRTSG